MHCVCTAQCMLDSTALHYMLICRLDCRRGVFLNYYPNVIAFHPTYQIENGINYGFGSFCFFMSGLLMYIQVSTKI